MASAHNNREPGLESNGVGLSVVFWWLPCFLVVSRLRILYRSGLMFFLPILLGTSREVLVIWVVLEWEYF